MKSTKAKEKKKDKWVKLDGDRMLLEDSRRILDVTVSTAVSLFAHVDTGEIKLYGTKKLNKVGIDNILKELNA